MKIFNSEMKLFLNISVFLGFGLKVEIYWVRLWHDQNNSRREVLIRFSPIVGWNFQINLVGSFSFIVFSIYKMIESQPSTLTAANIWIETWLGKKHSNIWKIERQTNVLLNGIVRSKGKSCKKMHFVSIYFLENVVFPCIRPFALCLTSYLHNCVVFWKFNQ